MQRENKNVMLNSFQHPRRLFSTRGFTLIELLVVVLIIGILAAVAVPQYQKAVLKSRFATIKNLTKNLADAEEIYYLANGNYTPDASKLDINIPVPLSSTLQTEYSTYEYSWGSCQIEIRPDVIASTYCMLYGNEETFNTSKRILTYAIYLNHSSRYPGTTSCFAYGTDRSAIQYKICQSETGKQTQDVSATNYREWYY